MARLNWLAELVVCCAALTVTAVDAADVGRIKVSIGAVHIERAAERLPGSVDTAVRASDIIVTGPKSSVGVTFVDQTRVSAGPNSVLVINGYAYDHVTQEGVFDATLKRGTLGVVSGKMTKQSPNAATIRTPTLTLGIRGTQLVVYAGE